MDGQDTITFESGTIEPDYITVGAVVDGRYEIRRLIDRGGMGAVYEATDRSLHQSVALKTIRSDRAGSARATERFKREALLARRVTHRNVCRVFDVGDHGGEMFLTMELLEGETLAQRLRRVGRMEPAEILPLVEQMVAALAAAHAAGVVHRDFKCSNVISSGDRIVVTDFGLAHDLAANGHETSSDGFVGSPAYVAPEQVNGRNVSFASDIYSLGVVMFEMTTGQLPFVGATPMATAVMRLTEPPPFPRTLVPALPVQWERVILRCLEREPVDRFAVVDDVVAALTSTAIVRGPRTRRRRRVAAGVTGGVLAMAGVVGWIGLRPSGSHETRPALGTLAITDLADRGGQPDSAWRGTALAELFAAELGDDDALRVLSRAQVATGDHAQLAKLGASTVLEGSYRTSGPTLTVDVRVVDLRDGHTVTEVEESGASTALVDIAARTTTRLRNALGLPLVSPAGAAHAQSALSANPEAARHYTQGVIALRQFQPVVAQHELEAAIAAAPDQPMFYSALARAWHDLRSERRERDAALRAFELSTKQARQDRLAIEAVYREALKDWTNAVALRRALATFFPDNLDYGLALAEAERRAGHGDESRATLARLRRLPAPDGDDPRIDVAEASVSAEDPKLALAALARAVDRARRRGAVGVEAEARLLECTIQTRGAYTAQAQSACHAADALFATQKNLGGQARTALALANIEIDTRHMADATKFEDQARALYRELGSQTGQTEVIRFEAIAYKRAGDLKAAERLYREALAAFRDQGEWPLEISTTDALSAVLTDQGRFGEALPLYHDVIAKAHEHGMPLTEANAMSNLSITLSRRGELVEARRLAESAVELWRQLGRANDAVYGLDSMEQIALRQGRLADARALEEEALATREKLGWIGGPSRQNLAEIEMEEGHLERADTLARKAVDEFHSQGQQGGEMYALDILVRVLVRAGRIEDATAAAKREAELREQTGAASISIMGSLSLARAARGDVQGAVTALRSAIANSVKAGEIDSLIDQEQVLAEILVLHGDPAQARRALAALEHDATAHGYVQAVHDGAALGRRVR